MANPLRQLLKRIAPAFVAALLGGLPATLAQAANILGEFYSNDVASNDASCNAGSCAVLFPPLPSGKGLAVTSVACTFRIVGGAASITEMRLYTLSAPSGFGTFLKPVLLSVVNSTRTYQSDDVVLHLVPVGSRPGVIFIAVNAQPGQLGPMRCHIAGILRP